MTPLFHFLQIFLPFQGQHALFSVIALFTGGDEIILGALAAAGQRDNMIHGNVFVGNFFITIITDS